MTEVVRAGQDRREPTASGGLLPATAFAALTGVSRERLRTWERRHGFPVPVRSGAGPRRYRLTDAAAVIAVRRAVEAGVPVRDAVARRVPADVAPSSAVLASIADAAPVPVVLVSGPDPLRVEWVNAAVRGLDGGPRPGDTVEDDALRARFFAGAEPAEIEHRAWGRPLARAGAVAFALPADAGARPLVALLGLADRGERLAREAPAAAEAELETLRRRDERHSRWLDGLAHLARAFQSDPGPSVVASGLDVLIRATNAVDAGLATYVAGRLVLPGTRRGVLERDAEVALLAGLLDGAVARQEGGVALVEGVPGIGKSRLLAAVCEQAAAGGCRVLTARGTELESQLAFGGVRQLFAATVLELHPAEAARALRGPAALARPVLGLSADAAPGAPVAPGAPSSPGLAEPLHGLFWLAANLTEERPLVLAVDDLHWLDEESARFVVYLARRVAGLPLLLLATAHPAEPGADPVAAAELARLGSVVRPQPLSPDAVARLLGAAPGSAGAPSPADVHRVTGGNPFLVGELVRSLEAGQGPEALESLGPAHVARGTLGRIERISEDAVRLARALALFAEGAALGDAAATAGLEPEPAARAADRLIAAGVLAPDEPLSFLHPLVRSAVYRQLGPFERREGHRRAAGVLGRRAAPPEDVAAHLLHSPPAGDANTVVVLSAAADRALAGCAPRAAARYLERALEEPPEREERWAARIRLGRLQAMIGVPQAEATLRAALDESATAEQRVESALALAATAYAHLHHDEAVEVLLALRASTELDPERRLEADGLAAAAAWDSSRHAHVYREVADALPADLQGATRAERTALAQVAGRMFDRCEPHTSVRAVVLRAVEPDPPLTAGGIALDPLNLLIACGALQEAQAHAEDWQSQARRTGHEALYVSAQLALARIAYLRGELAAAEAGYRLGLDLPGAVPVDRAMLGCGLVTVLLARGCVDEAETVLDAVAEGPGGPVLPVPVAFRRAEIALARGAPAAALPVYRRAYAALVERGSANPAETSWLRDMSDALAGTGRTEEAFELASDFAERAERFGEPRVVGIALITLGRRRSGEEAIARFERALDAVAPSPHTLVRVAAQVELGAALRRANARSRAKEHLAAALDTAERSGAAPLADRALAELRSLGARPRRRLRTGVEALTPSEERIVRLAAGGMTNREIASHLFLTVKTVEMHLVRAYRKLDVRSRRELSEALAGGGAA